MREPIRPIEDIYRLFRMGAGSEYQGRMPLQLLDNQIARREALDEEHSQLPLLRIWREEIILRHRMVDEFESIGLEGNEKGRRVRFP